MAILEVQDIHTYYGDAYVLQGLSLQLEQGQILGLLGRNGVGKTTLMLALMGHARRFGGELRWAGTSFVHLAPADRVPLGQHRKECEYLF